MKYSLSLLRVILLHSERSSSSCFLHRKTLESLDCVRFQLDQDASRALNHNASRHVLREFIRAWTKPLVLDFTSLGTFSGILPNILGAKAHYKMR